MSVILRSLRWNFPSTKGVTFKVRVYQVIISFWNTKRKWTILRKISRTTVMNAQRNIRKYPGKTDWSLLNWFWRKAPLSKEPPGRKASAPPLFGLSWGNMNAQEQSLRPKLRRKRDLTGKKMNRRILWDSILTFRVTFLAFLAKLWCQELAQPLNTAGLITATQQGLNDSKCIHLLNN